jgi:hypothetical protein
MSKRGERGEGRGGKVINLLIKGRIFAILNSLKEPVTTQKNPFIPPLSAVTILLAINFLALVQPTSVKHSNVKLLHQPPGFPAPRPMQG